MTKEETLHEKYSEGIEYRGVRCIFPKTFPKAYEEFVLAAMDAYARQEAVEFQNWIRDNTVADGAPKLLHTTGRKTTEELYDLYLTYKNKTDGQ